MRADQGGLRLHRLWLADHFGEEHGSGVDRESGLQPILDGDQGVLVHDLHRSRHQARRDDARHCFHCSTEGVVIDAESAHVRLQREETDQGSGDHAEGAFRSHDDPFEVQAWGIGGLATQDHHLTTGHHHFEPEDMAGGRPLRETVGPA